MASLSEGNAIPILTQNQEEDEEASFMQRLKSIPQEAYYFQVYSVRESPKMSSGGAEEVVRMFPRYFEMYPQGVPIQPIHLRGVKHYSFGELQNITTSFNEQNIICQTFYGRLFQGMIEEDLKVLVKTWDFFFLRKCLGNNLTRIHDEINTLIDPRIKSHPNIVKLIGFHCDRNLAVIYEGGPKEILTNHLLNDNFGWDDRMKVAIGIGSVLKLFHDCGIVHGGIESSNILIDEAYSPKIFNFQMYTHPDDPDSYLLTVNMKYQYCADKHLKGPVWSMSHDIFAYGILLLELVTKQNYLGDDAYWFIMKQLREPQKAFLRESFYIDECFGSDITELIMKCLRVEFSERPAIGTVMCQLEELVNSIPSSKQRKICH